MEVLENYAHISFVVRELGGSRGFNNEQVSGLEDIQENMGLAPLTMPIGRQPIENGEDIMPRTLR